MILTVSTTSLKHAILQQKRGCTQMNIMYEDGGSQ